jgi:hypothetical protein
MLRGKSFLAGEAGAMAGFSRAYGYSPRTACAWSTRVQPMT